MNFDDSISKKKSPLAKFQKNKQKSTEKKERKNSLYVQSVYLNILKRTSIEQNKKPCL